MKRRSGVLRVGLVLALVVSLVSAVQLMVSPGANPAGADASAGIGGLFMPAAGRLLDTRNGTGGYSSPMPAHTVRTVTAAGVAGIPATGVSALALTLTAVGAATIGAVSVASGDVATPTGTALVFNPGDSVSNTALVALHADGTLHVLADHAVHLLIDVQGYFTAGGSTAPGGFVALDQARIADTRSGLNLPQARVPTGSAVTLHAADLDAGVPADASAVYVNIAVLNQAAIGYLRTYAAGDAVPTTGALDFDDTTQSLSVAIPLSGDGSLSVLVGAGGPVDLIIDIQGYFTPSAAAGMFTPMAVRLLDTRAAPVRTIGGNSVLTLKVADVGGLPTVASGLAAVALNLRTVENSANITAGGYLRLWPSDQVEPATSSLNYTSANTYRSNLAIVAPSVDGTVSIRNGGPGAIDLVVDAQGWFRATSPTSPTVTSPSFTDGQLDAAPDAAATFTFTAPPGVGNTPAVQFRYALDTDDPAIVDANSPTVQLSVTADGPHDLLVIAVDANGTESEPTDFHFEIGHDTPATAPEQGDLEVTITTTETITAEDGTTTTETSSESTDFAAAQAAQLPGAGVPITPRLSCSRDYRGYFSGAIIDLRNNCRFKVGNFAIRLTPPPPGATYVSYAAESGFTWYLNGKRRANTAPHGYNLKLPVSYVFHGTFSSMPNGSRVWGTDYLGYSYIRNRVFYLQRIQVTVDFLAVP